MIGFPARYRKGIAVFLYFVIIHPARGHPAGKDQSDIGMIGGGGRASGQKEDIVFQVFMIVKQGIMIQAWQFQASDRPELAGRYGKSIVREGRRKKELFMEGPALSPNPILSWHCSILT